MRPLEMTMLEYPLPSPSVLQSNGGPDLGHCFKRPVSVEIPSRFGPLQEGHSFEEVSGAAAKTTVETTDADTINPLKIDFGDILISPDAGRVIMEGLRQVTSIIEACNLAQLQGASISPETPIRQSSLGEWFPFFSFAARRGLSELRPIPLPSVRLAGQPP